MKRTSNRTRLAGFLVAAALLLATNLAVAQDETDGDESAEDTVWPQLIWSGFVDTFMVADNFNDDVDLTLGLDQAEVDLEAHVVSGLMIRMDVNYFPTQPLFSAYQLLEQAYIRADFASGLFLIAGKQNAPIGSELIDAPDMYQFSHSLVFDILPGNLTGFFGGWTNDALTVTAWVTNDADVPAVVNNATLGGRLEYALDLGYFAASTLWGPVTSDVPTLMIDVDTALSFGNLNLFAEFNYGDRGNATSTGVMGKVNYAFGDALGATARFDWVDREYDPIQNVMSATGAFYFPLATNFSTILEARADIPDEGDTELTLAIELLATFN